jgi:hypothetical protein
MHVMPETPMCLDGRPWRPPAMSISFCEESTVTEL